MRWCSCAPTPPASSRARACRWTAAWACELRVPFITTDKDETMSSSKKPVVVYGASGYTGRLVCEYLREYNIPFIAAGRSKEKVDAAMKSNVAGIETASFEVAEVAHTVDALTELFNGASVVLNTVGPFAKFGPEV